MSQYVVMLSWDDAPHLSEEAKAELMEAFPLHERDARTKGLPQFGAGRIYPVSEKEIVVEPFPIPLHWRHVYGLDVGWKRTAALWAALDPDSDILYLYSEHYMSEAQAPVHAQAIKSRGDWIPGVVDPASMGSSQVDGSKLFEIYSSMLHSLTPADNEVEAGIHRVWMRLSSGRLKVFRTLQYFLKEYGIYRRDDKGKPIKQDDHLLDCLKYICSSGIQIAAQQPYDRWGELINKRSQHTFDYNPLQFEDAPKFRPR